MARKQPRKIRGINPPSTKTARRLKNPDAYELSNFRWRVLDEFIDYEDEEWGWDKVDIREFFQKLLPRLHEYETMTWQELLQRQSCHYSPVDTLNPQAQNKLKQKYPQYDIFHQIDMYQPCRLLGIRDGVYFYLVWHIPHHNIY